MLLTGTSVKNNNNNNNNKLTDAATALRQSAVL
jgi:hypothetical protein